MSAPTHVLWREGGVEFVTLDGYDPDNPDLTEIPPGLDLDYAMADFESRTLTLDTARLDKALHRQIDELARAFRASIDPPELEAVHWEKLQEARDHLKGGEGPWVLLEEEAAALAITVEQLAADVVARADAARPLKGKIEGARRAAKLAVTSAATAEAKRAAAVVDWESLVQPPPQPQEPEEQ